MHKLAIPCLVMASINIFVGIVSISLAKMSRGMREYLPFALLSFGVAFYEIATIGLYNSLSISEGIFWQHLQVSVIPVITIFLAWFSQILTGQEKNRILRALIAISSLMCIANAGLSGSLTLSAQNPAIKHINIPHIPPITYYEVQLGRLIEIQIFIAVAAYLYVCFLFLKRYKESRETTLLLIVAGQIIYFIGVVNDSLVGLNVYEYIYINEYTFFFLVLAMVALLMSRHINMVRAVEELNENLEYKVAERTAEIEKLNRELQQLVDFDALTGVHNRRFFDRYLKTEITKIVNASVNACNNENCGNPHEDIETNFGLAILDIDRFKYINDNFGHPVGDRVLIEIIEIIKNNVFMRDILCRYGGDEFVLLMPKTSSEGVVAAAEKIRKEVESKRFYFDDEHANEQITVSIGVVSLSEVSELDNDKLMKLADDRLLRAKLFGRNMVVADSEIPTDKFRIAG